MQPNMTCTTTAHNHPFTHVPFAVSAKLAARQFNMFDQGQAVTYSYYLQLLFIPLLTVPKLAVHLDKIGFIYEKTLQLIFGVLSPILF